MDNKSLPCKIINISSHLAKHRDSTATSGSIILEKKGVDSEETDYLIKVFFENNPLILRKIEVNVNEEYLQISIFNHNYNRDFKANFFKLINPSLLN